MRLDKILEVKTPPPGGLQNLRKRLRDNSWNKYSRRYIGWSLAGATAVLTLVLLLPSKPPVAPPSVLEIPWHHLGNHLKQEELSQPIKVSNGAVIKLFENQNVVYYRMVSEESAAFASPHQNNRQEESDIETWEAPDDVEEGHLK